MAPTTSKRTAQTKQNKDARQNQPVSSVPVDYAAVQSDEVEALRAIFMDDYQEVAVESAWNKTTDHRFKLKIAAFSDANSAVTLSVRLTATYPRSAPLLDIAGLEAFHERTQSSIRNVLLQRPKELLGEVMIHAIASEIQEILEDAVQARQQGTLPSLEDERAVATQAAQALAQQADAEQKQLQEEAQREEQRILDQMVEEELNRREKRRVKQVSEVSDSIPVTQSDKIMRFDQTSTIRIANQDVSFSAVQAVSRDRDLTIAQPVVSNSQSIPLVAVRTCRLRSASRDDIEETETLLDRLRKLKHRSVQRLHLFSMESTQGGSGVRLCEGLFPRGSLADLLSVAGTLPPDKVRQYAIELLEGLEECHRHGITHGAINSTRVYLSNAQPTGPVLACFGGDLLEQRRIELTSRWQPSEILEKTTKASLKRVDVWDLGVLILQMSLGSDITQVSSPQTAWTRAKVTRSFEDLVIKIFSTDGRPRASAFDLLSAEFLRCEDPVIESRAGPSPTSNGSGLSPAMPRRLRHESSSMLEPLSRYAQDFTEIGRLGKGGFGEVVKARNKLDGGIYAIKKIHRAPQLDRILSEVMLLNRLNHPYVVRYYATWVEQDSAPPESDTFSTTDDTISEGPRMDFGYQSTGGLDFVSSRGYAQVEFGSDSDSDADSDTSELPSNDDKLVQSTNSLIHSNKRSQAPKLASTLFIQMEFCERRSLRDLLHKGLQEDDAWRFVRQITEGLAHIHGHGIIHRDLKPDNIFIDSASNPKIGDFGLATTSQYLPERSHTFNSQASVDMTRSVGTALYVAPELSGATSQPYTDKVDMYSLGIMFFEMCQTFSTAMERIQALQAIRKKDYELPAAYLPTGGKAAQGRVVSCLIAHKPSERPSSAELLRTGLLPVKIEDETIRQALRSLTDRNSPNHQTMMTALFASNQLAESQVRALAWDVKDTQNFDDASRLRARAVVKEAVISIFRLHGAEEVQRGGLLPRSSIYTAPNVVSLLDASGNLLQLPYDLTLPMARKIARSSVQTRCSYTIEPVFRDAFSGGPPQSHEEIDFDIVTSEQSIDAAYHEAELVKVVDELVVEPVLNLPSSAIAFYINHSDILDLVLAGAQVDVAQHLAVKDCLSKLGFRNFTWEKIRSELRSPTLALSSWSVDYLETFDYRETPEKAFSKLMEWAETLLQHGRSRLTAAVQHLQDVLGHAVRLNLHSKILVSPLGCINAKYYEHGMMVQCVLERKHSRDVLAAGGRYDAFIKTCRLPNSMHQAQSAVGVSIGLDRLVASALRSTKIGNAGDAFAKDTTKSADLLAKRCSVLLVTGLNFSAQAAGTKLLASLWSSGISAERGVDNVTHDEAQYAMIVMLRHESATTVKVQDTSDSTNESDVPIASLVSYLQQELREKQGIKRRPIIPGRHSSQPTVDRKNNVQVLMSQHRSKKSNKYHIVEAAQQKWSEKLDQWKDAPILAIETRDDALDLVKDTRLSDAESWRKALHGVPPNERQYLHQVQEILSAWRKKWSEGEQSREACLYNFRTGYSIYYDVGL